MCGCQGMNVDIIVVVAVKVSEFHNWLPRLVKHGAQSSLMLGNDALHTVCDRLTCVSIRILIDAIVYEVVITLGVCGYSY